MARKPPSSIHLLLVEYRLTPARRAMEFKSQFVLEGILVPSPFIDCSALYLRGYTVNDNYQRTLVKFNFFKMTKLAIWPQKRLSRATTKSSVRLIAHIASWWVVVILPEWYWWILRINGWPVYWSALRDGYQQSIKTRWLERSPRLQSSFRTRNRTQPMDHL